MSHVEILTLREKIHISDMFKILYRSLWSVIAPGILFHVPVEESSFELSGKANELADFYLGGASNIGKTNL